jgi:hypothetical protein
MENYHTWARLFEPQKYYSWIIDRFHIPTRLFQLQKHGMDYPFRWLEQRLHKLGFRLVFITRSPESYEAAKVERLKVSGNPAQYDYLDIFIKEQSLYRDLVANQSCRRLNCISRMMTFQRQ